MLDIPDFKVMVIVLEIVSKKLKIETDPILLKKHFVITNQGQYTILPKKVFG